MKKKKKKKKKKWYTGLGPKLIGFVQKRRSRWEGVCHALEIGYRFRILALN
jgi:hypothetical protein